MIDKALASSTEKIVGLYVGRVMISFKIVDKFTNGTTCNYLGLLGYEVLYHVLYKWNHSIMQISCHMYEDICCST